MSTIGGSDNGETAFGFGGKDFDLSTESRGDIDPLDLSHLEVASGQDASRFEEELEDLAEAAQLASRSFRDFAMTDEGAEIIGYVLDGNFREGRSPDAQLLIDRVIGDLYRPGTDNTVQGFLPPDFVLVPIGADVENGQVPLPDDVRAATIFPDDGPAKILVASGLGLRDTLLISQEAFADAIVGHAEVIGVELAAGDLGARLTESLRLGSGIAGVDPSGTQPRGEIVRDGTVLDAMLR